MERVKDHRATIWRVAVSVAPSSRATRQQAMWAIYNRELQELSESFRFRAVAFLIVTIMVLAAVIHAGRYHNEVSLYDSIWRSYTASVEGISVRGLVGTPYPAMTPPWELAFLANGGQQHAPDVYEFTVGPDELPKLSNRRMIDDRLHAAESLDWAFFIRVVLSMSAFLLGYDIVCGKRQRAALKTLLSYSVDRWAVMVVKLSALFTCVSLPFLLGAFLSVLLLVTVGGLNLGQIEMLKILLVLVLGLWASAIFVLMATSVSLLAGEAGRSLTVLTLVWVLAVVVTPAASELLAHQIQPLRTERAVEQKLLKIRKDLEGEFGGGTQRSDEVAQEDGFAEEILAAKLLEERYARQVAFLNQVREEQFDQVRLARRLALLSPMAMIQDLTEQITGSGIVRDRSFILQVENFRNDLRQLVRELDGRDPSSPHVYFLARYMSNEVQVEAGDLQKFPFQEPGVREGLQRASVQILLLSLLTVMLFGAALMGFASYEVG